MPAILKLPQANAASARSHSAEIAAAKAAPHWRSRCDDGRRRKRRRGNGGRRRGRQRGRCGGGGKHGHGSPAAHAHVCFGACAHHGHVHSIVAIRRVEGCHQLCAKRSIHLLQQAVGAFNAPLKHKIGRRRQKRKLLAIIFNGCADTLRQVVVQQVIKASARQGKRRAHAQPVTQRIAGCQPDARCRVALRIQVVHVGGVDAGVHTGNGRATIQAGANRAAGLHDAVFRHLLCRDHHIAQACQSFVITHQRKRSLNVAHAANAHPQHDLAAVNMAHSVAQHGLHRGIAPTQITQRGNRHVNLHIISRFADNAPVISACVPLAIAENRWGHNDAQAYIGGPEALGKQAHKRRQVGALFSRNTAIIQPDAIKTACRQRCKLARMFSAQAAVAEDRRHRFCVNGARIGVVAHDRHDSIGSVHRKTGRKAASERARKGGLKPGWGHNVGQGSNLWRK